MKTDSFICDVYGNQEIYRENMEILKCFDDCNRPLSRKNDDKTTNSYGQQLIEFLQEQQHFHSKWQIRYGQFKAYLQKQ